MKCSCQKRFMQQSILLSVCVAIRCRDERRLRSRLAERWHSKSNEKKLAEHIFSKRITTNGLFDPCFTTTRRRHECAAHPMCPPLAVYKRRERRRHVRGETRQEKSEEKRGEERSEEKRRERRRHVRGETRQEKREEKRREERSEEKRREEMRR